MYYDAESHEDYLDRLDVTLEHHELAPADVVAVHAATGGPGVTLEAYRRMVNARNAALEMCDQKEAFLRNAEARIETLERRRSWVVAALVVAVVAAIWGAR